MTRAWDTIVDCAFVLLTTALVLSLLDPTYDSRTYLVVGLVPVALLLCLAAALRGREHGVWAYVIIALVAYPPLGALLALQDPGPFIIPTPASTGQVLAGHVTGPVEIASTLPPVVADGVVMVVPYAIGFLAGGAAAWLALGTTRPLAPQVPLLAGLAAAIPLGVLTPNLTLGRGVLLGALCLLWGSLRARRGRVDLVGGARWAWARPVAATLLVATTATGVFLLLPDVDRDDRVLYQQDGLGDVDLGEVPSPVEGGLLDNGKLLQTRGVPDRAPLRFVALDLYDGTAWTVAEKSRGVREGGDTFRRIGPDITPVGDGREVRVDVRVLPGYTSDWLPLLGELTSLRFEETNGRTQLREVRYNQATGSALVPGGLTPGDRYTFTALTSSPRLRVVDEVRRSALARQRTGAFLDVYLTPFRRGGRTPLDRLTLFMDHLRTDGHIRLGDSSQTPAALGRLFLGADTMTATPHQYAATVALAATRFGIPSRVVVGATPDRRGAVRADDVESWVELQLADGSWRSVRAKRFLGTQGLLDAEEQPPPAAPAAPDPDRADARGDRDDRSPRDRRDTPPGEEVEPSSRSVVAVALLVGAVSVVALCLVLIPVLKLVRRNRRRRAGEWSRIYVGGWQEVLDTARDRGTPVPEHLGRVEQARRLGRGTELARQADAAVFAPTPTTAEHRERFLVEAERLRRSLVAELPRRRRLLTWLSPASLLTSWARRRGRTPSSTTPTTPSAQEPEARPREPVGR